MNTMTYGQTVFYTGIALIGASSIAFIIGMACFAIKRKALKKQLMDKYGF